MGGEMSMQGVTVEGLARVLAGLPDVVLVVDALGIISAVHGHPDARLGWADDLSGLNVFDLFAKQSNRALHAASLAEVVAKPGVHGPIAVSSIDPEGRIHELELRLTNLLHDPEVGGIVVVARNITGRQDEAEAARRREAWSQALLTRASDFTLVVDRSGALTHVGSAAEEVLGWSPDQLTGKRVDELLVTGSSTALGQDALAALSAAVDAEPVTAVARHANGRECLLDLVVTHLSSAAQGTLVVSATELSDERIAEDLLGETAHLLESVARGAPLHRTLSEVTSLLAKRVPGSLCIASVRDESGRLRHQGGDVPDALVAALDLFGPTSRPMHANATFALTEVVGTEGGAADAVAELGLRSCWVNAVVGARADMVSGSLVVLHPGDRDPSLGEFRLLERYGNVVAIALERAELSHRLEFRANFDELTGLPNRHELLARIADRSRRRPDDPITLLFADLDRFKLINDSLGHAAGDALLREVGERFQGLLARGDTVGRLGGDEFVVLCEERHTEADALAMAERLRSTLEEPYHVGGAVVVVTASVGITTSSAGDDPEAPLGDADLAMYEAKQQGRNRSALFHGDLRLRAQERLGLEGALRQALVCTELENWYQPQVDLADGQVHGVEALVRWNRPGVGIVEPGTFIPVAEDSGLIVPLGRLVLDAALADALSDPLDDRDLVMTVNLSARELADPTLVSFVAGALERHGIAAHRLCLEVTESDLVADADASAAVLLRLKDLGVLLAIDDFGTGYATLDYVRRFAMADILKIDRSFIGGLDVEGSKDRAIVSAVIMLGQALGFRVVAEGVETPRQLQVLRDLGCDSAQGWLFARPVPARRLPATLREIAEMGDLDEVLPVRPQPVGGAG